MPGELRCINITIVIIIFVTTRLVEAMGCTRVAKSKPGARIHKRAQRLKTTSTLAETVEGRVQT